MMSTRRENEYWATSGESSGRSDMVFLTGGSRATHRSGGGGKAQVVPGRGLPDRNDQRARAGSYFLRPTCGTTRVEIQIDAKLAEPRDLRPRAGVRHPVDHPQRRVPEMSDARLDQIRLV